MSVLEGNRCMVWLKNTQIIIEDSKLIICIAQECTEKREREKKNNYTSNINKK